MNGTRVGLTSPLAGEEVPAEDTEVIRQRIALERAGAKPVILRIDMDPFRIIDELGLRGILFSGGGDVGAARYGGDEALANDRVNLQRDAFEFALMHDAFKHTLPVLAICRGMQVANVLLGGTLIEDIRQHLGAERALPHHQVKDIGLPATDYAHEISIASGTALHELAGAECIKINSFHHQALSYVAPALSVTARASDGVIEAVEFAPSHAGADGCRGFFIGVQWHPESIPHDRLSRRLYVRFVEACKAR